MVKCLKCKSKIINNVEFGKNKEIPDWYLKEGNYSILPKILTCNDKYNANKNELTEEIPKTSNTEVRIPIKVKKGDWIFYWATDSNKNSRNIKDPVVAYNKNKNRGLINSDGDKVELILNTPQPYHIDGVTYPRHVHYVLLKDDNTWSMDIQTVLVKPYIDKPRVKSILKSNDHIIIYAL